MMKGEFVAKKPKEQKLSNFFKSCGNLVKHGHWGNPNRVISEPPAITNLGQIKSNYEKFCQYIQGVDLSSSPRRRDKDLFHPTRNSAFNLRLMDNLERIEALCARFNSGLTYDGQISYFENGKIAEDLQQIFRKAGVPVDGGAIASSYDGGRLKLNFKYAGEDVMEITIKPDRCSCESSIARSHEHLAPELSEGKPYLPCSSILTTLNIFLGQQTFLDRKGRMRQIPGSDRS